MRRCRAALAVLTIMLISLLVAGPASAGGPTSVLLVVPGSGRTASLYTGATDYEALAALVGAFDSPGVAGTSDPSGTSHDVGTGVTLTWLIHDVQVWRVDRVYLDAKGGPWISTQSDISVSGTIWDIPPVWHTAARGKELEALLDRLGVSPDPRGDGNAAVSGDSTVGGGTGTVIVPPAATAAELKKPTIQRADAGTRIAAGVGWGLAGLALGVALTVAGMRLFPNSRSALGELATAEPAEDGPADVGTDPPGPVPDSELNRSSTDDLSLPSHWR